MKILLTAGREREVPKASGHIALQNIKAKIKSRREHQN